MWGLKDNDFILSSCITNRQNAGLIINHFELTAGALAKESIALGPGARRVMATPNAGGSSEWSEAVSVEVLSFLCSAVLHRTEMEIEYMPGSKITDYSAKVFGRDLGVSVTRAMKFCKKGAEGPFTEEDAMKLLRKKLHGVIESTRGVVSQTWDKQILHVWTQSEYMTGVLWNAYEKLEDELKSNTLVIVTVCEGAEWIFKN